MSWNQFIQKRQQFHEIFDAVAFLVTHSVEIRKFLSLSFYCKFLKNFRENNVLRALYSKIAFGMATFGNFRANLRKSDLFGLIEEGLDY